MQLFIDNMDGSGIADYSVCMLATDALRIERKLNQITYCTVGLCCSVADLAIPKDGARLFALTDAGQLLFSGYLIAAPSITVCGEETQGMTVTAHVTAASDEWLVDQMGAETKSSSLGLTIGTFAEVLTAQQGTTLLDASAASAVNDAAGIFSARASTSFSEQLGDSCSFSYCAYQVQNGALNLQSIGSTTHTLYGQGADANLLSLSLQTSRPAVNDIVLCGAREAANYVTEVFTGDGTTDTFFLSHAPFEGSATDILRDSFDTSMFNPTVWNVVDPGSYFLIGSGGAMLQGGNGFDGQTKLTYSNQIEMGGSFLAEANGVLLQAASDGVLCGFYEGDVRLGNCLAGIRIRQSSGVTIASAFVDGVETGTAYPVTAGHVYSFRVRVAAVEAQRVLQTFYVAVGGERTRFGGGLISSPLHIVCEVQDLGEASNLAATVLCDTTVANSSAICSFTPINSIHLVGSIRSIALTHTGPIWATTRSTDGTVSSCRFGVAGEGADATLSRSGVLRFFSGRIPAAAEMITLSYRTSGVSAARKQDMTAIALAAQHGLPGIRRWKGTLSSPTPVSSVDCSNAAAALLAAATSEEAGISGRCKAYNMQANADVWPGDLVEVHDGAATHRAVVHSLLITDLQTKPETLLYDMEFANAWAKSVSLEVHEGLPADAPYPIALDTDTFPPVASLSALSVVSVSGNAIAIDAGLDAPAGGGFEVRRADLGFAPGTDSNLVLRTATRGFSIPRVSQQESYFVRMYDASTPPRYSRFSAEIRVTVPLG